jgi:hypothetical protein
MKKRSIGVSIFGWWYIVSGIVGILNFPFMLMMRAMPMQGSPVFMKQVTGNFYLGYVLLYTIASLITGVGILKLKSWARKLLIILCVIGVLYGIFFSVSLLTRSSEFVEMSMPSASAQKNVSPEALAAIKYFTQVVLTVSVVAGIFISVGFAAFIIWFFMRKSVKEQFEPDINCAAPQLK